MARPTKYYVSTKDGVLYEGLQRLTQYFLTREEAEIAFKNKFHSYNTLFLRQLLPDNKTRKTLKSK